MSLLPNRSNPSRSLSLKVHAPREPGDKDQFARFVSDLNAQLGLISERFGKTPHTGNAGNFVTQNDLVDAVRTISQPSLTSEGEDGTAAGSGTGTGTSRGSDPGGEDSQAAVNNAVPTVAPPNVAAASNVGTTTSPVIFSLSDHTHGGILGSPVASGVSGEIPFYSSTFEVSDDPAFFWDNTNKRLGVGTNTPGTDLDVARSAGGATVSGDVRNTSNTAASFARHRAQVAGSTADDPFALFEISGVQSWAIGIDNSTADSFKISRSAALGTNDSIVITTSDAVSLTGKVTTYENIATAGKGLAPITDVVSLVTQGADIADTALANTGVAGLYTIKVYASTTTADGAAGTFTVNIKFTDDSTAQTVTVGPISLTTAGAFAQSTVFVRRNTAGITYGVTHTGTFGTAKYSLYVSSERIA